jgi:hypothetical protein
MNQTYDVQKQRRDLALLEAARARGTISLWEVVAACTNSPVDFDRVSGLLGEAGIDLDERSHVGSSWSREADAD